MIVDCERMLNTWMNLNTWLQGKESHLGLASLRPAQQLREINFFHSAYLSFILQRSDPFLLSITLIIL
jgi:hypothetical protein